MIKIKKEHAKKIVKNMKYDLDDIMIVLKKLVDFIEKKELQEELVEYLDSLTEKEWNK